MSKALSRKFRGHDADARAFSRAEARRSGKKLGDWLDEEIEDEDARDGETEDDDRIDALTRRLARPSEARLREDDEDRPRRRWRDEARDMRRRDYDDEEERRSARRARADEDDFDIGRDRAPRARRDLDDHYERGRRGAARPDPERLVADAAIMLERRVAESERHTARAVENLAEIVKRGQRRDDGAVVKRAVAAFAQRAQESERHTARALTNLAGMLEEGQRSRESAEEGLAYLAERLGRIEAHLSEQPAGASVRPIRSALARLESRLDRLSKGDHAADFEEALSGLDRRLADISRRLEDRAPAAPARDAIAAADPAEGAPLARRPLADAIAQITERQRALEAAPAAVVAPAPVASAEPAAPDIWQGEPPAQRFSALNASLDALSRQIETVRTDAGERADQQIVLMRQVEGLRREIEEVGRAVGDLAPRASVAAVETALRDLVHRVDTQRQRGVADELLAPAERIAGELRAVIRELDPSPIVRNLHADVQTIGRRLDAMQQPEAADAGAIRQLTAQTRDIRDQLAALVARPLPLEKIETRLFDLTQRVDALTHAAPGAAKAAAALDMGELARSIRAIVAAETGKSFDTFNHRLEQLGARLDEAVANAGGKRFDELGQRIDQLGATLAQRIDRSAAAARQPANTVALERLIADLGRKIDTALDDKPHAPGFEEIGKKIERLETRLDEPARGVAEIGKKIERLESRFDPGASDSIARIEEMLARPVADRQFAELAERIDQVRETLAQRLDEGAAAPAVDTRYIEEAVRALDSKIETAIASGPKTPDLAPIQAQLDQLFAKVERLAETGANANPGAPPSRPAEDPRLDEIGARLERMQAALAQRAEQGYRVEERQNDLAALVGQLADRINAALDPRGDADALRALETQIGALSQRLDASHQNSPALAGVEARISALVDRMEENKAATTLAAEEAVRRATQDILRQANPAPGALREALERELSDIRKAQDEAGQRTHETLLAVHETLERVVDRLAMFEDELTEIRETPAPTAPAFPPASETAPARRRAAGEAARDSEPPMTQCAAPRVEIGPEDDLMDFLVAPGAPRPARREPEFSAPEGRAARVESSQTDFIAAARRAAQQAAADAEAAEKARQARRAPPTEAAPAAKAEARGGLAALQDRKRPLLLGLGALVLLVGAYSIAKVGIHGVETMRHNHEAMTEAAPVDTEAAPAVEAGDAKEPAVKDAAPAAPAAASPPSMTQGAGAPALNPLAPPRKVGPRTEAAPSVDASPTGSIGQINPLAAPDAVSVIQSLAATGDATAQYELAVRYADGRGVARDARAAAQWFEKAAAQGLAPAQYRLGSLYEKGVGVERDYARAKKYYQSAAEAGNARAMHNLAVLLAEGGEGGKPDYRAASEWFLKAAEYGVRDSQYNLAILYARGLGVGQNLTQSYVWFAAAADQGDADAAKKRDEVAARLDSKELSTAKSLAAGFRAKEPLRAANDVLPPKGGWESLKAPAGPSKAAPKPAVKAKISAI